MRSSSRSATSRCSPSDTLAALLIDHRQREAAITVLTARVPDPTGYGRILRDADGLVTGIVEHRDADDVQRAIDEINSGTFVFDADVLRAALAQLAPTNDQGELYLTDVLTIAREAGQTVGAFLIDDLWQTEGINDRVQLSRMNAEVNRRILEHWMREGVTIVDPATTWVHASVDLGPDVTLLPGTSLQGATSVAAGATIGPDTTLVDVEIGENATVTRTHGSLSVIGAGASVGPFAYLRPGTTLGARRQDRHLRGDQERPDRGGREGPPSELSGRRGGRRRRQHRRRGDLRQLRRGQQVHDECGAFSFVGSNSVLTAPLEIADGSYVAAGSTITSDVGIGELAVSRGRQRNVPGWVARKRAGTKTARAAEAALDQRRLGETALEDQQTESAPLQDQQVTSEGSHQ